MAGPVTGEALAELLDRFRLRLENAGTLDGLVLALHGAFVTDSGDSADLSVIETARSALGDRPIGVSLDLHANVTTPLVAASTFVTGYHTSPTSTWRQPVGVSQSFSSHACAGRRTPSHAWQSVRS